MAFSEKIKEVLINEFKSKGLSTCDAMVLTGLKQIERFDELSEKEKIEMQILEEKIH